MSGSIKLSSNIRNSETTATIGQPGSPSPPPLPERGSQVVDETCQGVVGPHGALDVHLSHDVFGELDPAQTWCDARGVDGFNQALLVLKFRDSFLQ